MINTIIFDLEGVIIDTEKIWDMESKQFLGRRGIEYNRDKLKPLLTGLSISDGAKVMKEKYFLEGDIPELANERTQIITNLFSEKIEFIGGFLEFYEQIKDNYKMCIGTALKKDLLELVDKKLNLKSMFNNQIYTIEDVGGKSKSDPSIFLYGAKMLGALPENCAVIEDAPKGIEGAKNAGMYAIGITTTYNKDKLNKANLIIKSFKEINLDELKAA